MRPAAVFFDLDGTLVDTAPDFYAGISRLRTARGEPPLPYAPIRAAVSAGSKSVLAVAYPELSPEAVEPLRLAFLDDYEAHIADHSQLFDGLDAVLLKLEADGIAWGIVTNKPTRFTSPLLKALGLAGRAAAVVCADEVTQTKPHPEPMLLACARAGVAARECIYVGDHARDIEAGRRSEMLTVAAGWGYLADGETMRDWQADVDCATVAEFSQWLLPRL
ncbi:MAG: HAD-IA family hydrolase [Paraperlucidibaca sp.]